MKQAANNHTDEATQLEAIWQDFHKSGAQIDKATAEELEVLTQDMGRNRRIGLAVLTQSGAELVQTAERDTQSATVLAQAQISIREYLEHVKTQIEVMESADARIMLALCARPDMESILQRAQEQSA